MATLIGDFAPYQSIPTFESKYLMVPSYPAEDLRVRDPVNYAMLVDKSRVTLEGAECDKIGVSFNAFQFQSNRCIRPAGDCLRGQLEDLHNDDVSARKAGVNGLYFLDNYGNFSFGEIGEIHLIKHESDMQASVVLVTIRADDIRYTIRTSPAIIESASINSFEALSGNGGMSVVIKNIGTLESMYYISLEECSNGVLPPVSKTSTIASMQSAEIILSVIVDRIIGQEYSCTVILTSYLGTILDSKVVNFTTTDMEIDYGEQIPTEDDGGRTASGDDDDGGGSCDDCMLYV
jgi:hypothetical protein